MRRVLFALMLLVAMTQRAQSQTGFSGQWRMASVVPDGTADGAIREFLLELKADGTSVNGTVTGAPIVISDGRIDGSTVTLSGVTSGRPVSLNGDLSGDEIVMRIRCFESLRRIPRETQESETSFPFDSSPSVAQ